MTAISEIIETSIERVSADATLASVIGPLTSEGSVLVFEDDTFVGSLTTRKLARTRLNPAQAKIRNLIIHPPRISEDEDMEHVAQLMIDSDLVTLPVERDGEIIGVVRASDVLGALAGEVDSNLIARDVMSRPVDVLEPDALLSTAASMLKRKDISRLPVLEDGHVIGVITISNIIGNMLHHNKADVFMLEEHEVLQNTQVRNSMETSFATEHPDSPLSSIADRMAGGIHTVILSQDGAPMGILTQKDMLESLLFKETDESDLSVTVAIKDDAIEADVARAELVTFAEKYAEQLGVGTVKATLELHPQKHKGLPHVTTKLRILTDQVGISSIGDGWGESYSVKDALRKAESQMMR